MDMVSIIMPCYNSSRYIAESITSVVKQTYTNWELIIVDDGSTDSTLSIVKKIEIEEKRIKVFSTKFNTKNPANARNIGIHHAVGDYIAFIDSDDMWDFNKLECQIKFMKENEYSFTFTDYRCINSDNQIIQHKNIIPQVVSYQLLLKCNYIGLSTAIYNSREIGKFYFKNVGHEDYLYWLNILYGKHFAHGLDLKLVSYRVHNNSISSNKLKAATYTWNILRNHINLPFGLSVFYFLNYIFYAIKKRFF